MSPQHSSNSSKTPKYPKTFQGDKASKRHLTFLSNIQLRNYRLPLKNRKKSSTTQKSKSNMNLSLWHQQKSQLSNSCKPTTISKKRMYQQDSLNKLSPKKMKTYLKDKPLSQLKDPLLRSIILQNMKCTSLLLWWQQNSQLSSPCKLMMIPKKNTILQRSLYKPLQK